MNWKGLEALGFRRFSWNNGTIIEYWKGIGKDPDDFNSRIGIRFGEWKHLPFLVWVFYPQLMIPLRHIKTYDDLQELYRLLKWQEDIYP